MPPRDFEVGKNVRTIDWQRGVFETQAVHALLRANGEFRIALISLLTAMQQWAFAFQIAQFKARIRISRPVICLLAWLQSFKTKIVP